MKNLHRKNQEQGQIIILLAVSIVVVMVVAALAVDGGMIYSERRFAQNAADSAAFAGGGAVLNSGELDEVLVCPANSSYNAGSGNFSNANNVVGMAVTAAQSRASANNISSLPYLGYRVNNVVKEDFGLDENQGVFVECNDLEVDEDGDGEIDPKTLDVIVRVTSQVSTAFAHLIYPGPLQTTNEAKVSVSQTGTKSSGDAIISLGPGCDGDNGGIILAGNPTELTIENSGAFSNSCLKIGSNLNKTITVDGGFKIHGDVDGKKQHYGIIADKIYKGYSTLSLTYPDPPIPDCSGLTTYTNTSPTGSTIPAGHYTNGFSIHNGTYQFEPGLYCIDNSIHFNGGTITGVDVTFYFSEGSSAHFNGNADVKFFAPRETTHPYFGLLFYFEGSGSVLWNGGVSDQYNGLVYGPNRLFDIKGNAKNSGGSCPAIPGYTINCEDIKYPTQFVAYQVTLQASSRTNMINPSEGINTLQNNLFLKD